MASHGRRNRWLRSRCEARRRGHEGVVRTLTIRHSTLYSGGSDTKLKVWDLKSNSCTTLLGHTSCIRAIAVDEAGQTLYSGADDKKIKIWQAR